MKIYTRTGDKGETSLFGGKRIKKSDLRVDTYGTIDELNSAIGVVLSLLQKKSAILKNELISVQHDLFEIGAYLATPKDIHVQKGKRIQQTFKPFLTKRVLEIEKAIDRLTEKLEPMKTFILPGGSHAGSMLHLARTISRRAERRIVSLSQEQHIDEALLTYVNRLSDFLFTLARSINSLEKKKETTWIKKITR